MNNAVDLPVVQLERVPGAYAVLRFRPDEPVPDLHGRRFYSITRTDRETSVILDDDLVPPGVLAERDFALLRVKGELEFSLTGIMAGLTRPLAMGGVSVFTISTFDTDYLLFKEKEMQLAVDLLRAAGHIVSL